MFDDKGVPFDDWKDWVGLDGRGTRTGADEPAMVGRQNGQVGRCVSVCCARPKGVCLTQEPCKDRV